MRIECDYSYGFNRMGKIGGKSFSWHLNDELKKKLPSVAGQGDCRSCGIIAVAHCTSAIYAIIENLDHSPNLSYQHALIDLLKLYLDDHFVIDKEAVMAHT